MDVESQPSPQTLEFLRGSLLESIAIQTPLGEGKRSRAFRVRWQGHDCVLKLYEPQACAKHERRHGTQLARYEFLRNRTLFQVPGLERHIARPFAYWVDGNTQALIQELVPGTVFETFRRTAPDDVLRQLVASLRDIVSRAHAAGIYDLDLHPNNIMVAPQTDGPVLKLYDFNKIPFHEYSPNPVAALLLRLGVIRPESRDLRRLHLFTDPPGRSRFGTRRQ